MQFEEFDKKVREAADLHHPVYDEKAWSKMKRLLDIHLPQKKENKKRFLFLLLFFLLIGGAGTLFIINPWGKNDIKANREIKTDRQFVDGENEKIHDNKIRLREIEGHPVSENSESTNNIVNTSSASQFKRNNINEVSSNTNLQVRKHLRSDEIENNNRSVQKKYLITETKNRKADSKIIFSKDNKAIENNYKNQSLLINENNDLKIENVSEAQKSPELESNKIKMKKEEIVEKSDSEEVVSDSRVATDTKKDKIVLNKKSINKKNNSFFISFSAGPDISYVNAGKAGKMKVIAGIGAGYTIKNRFTIRTGFYAGRKIYSAFPYAYNPPGIFWTYYPYLENVEANCKVYEIPLSFNYNFGREVKQNWFASAGISSLLMKEETYEYYYKQTASGPTTSRKWTIKNENNHFFSVLTMSAGYQRRINKSISVIAEPYLKLPLAGVGYGKVKLNSSGILLTLAVKPIKQLKRK